MQTVVIISSDFGTFVQSFSVWGGNHRLPTSPLLNTLHQNATSPCTYAGQMTSDKKHGTGQLVVRNKSGHTR